MRGALTYNAQMSVMLHQPSIISGKEIAAELRAAIKAEIAGITAKGASPPGLAVVLVGDNPASAVYVRNKGKACEDVGMRSMQHTLDAETSERALLALIDGLNCDGEVNGILVQLPLPRHINEKIVLERIDPSKDVDGFHPYNLGRLMAGIPLLQPCTPYGVIKMLEHEGIDISGKDAVVVGRSNIVGKPMAMMLLERNATVTVCHSKTKDLAVKCRMADIVVAAVGRAEFVKGDWIKKGAVVIDVGINRGADGKLVGDVDFAGASANASYITPVPGGVGPMTIAILLKNTLEAYKMQHNQ